MPRPHLSRPHLNAVVVTVAVITILAVVATAAIAYSANVAGDESNASAAIANVTNSDPDQAATIAPTSSPDEGTTAPPVPTASTPRPAPSKSTGASVHAPTLAPTVTPAPATARPPSAKPTAAPTPPATATPQPTAAPTAAPTPPPPSNTVVTILAAGDVRSNTDGIMATAKLIQAMPGPIVLNVGDDSANGTAAEYADYFAPAWGQFKSRIYPTPGNHEYNTAGAAPYFAYYGSRAGTAGQGWYSFDFTGTSWHVIELNGNLAHGVGSTQETWLRRDLAANAGKHIIAFWHQPRFSSGTEHGSDTSYTAFWNDLTAAHADIVLNGHDHDYERFALQNGAGQADPEGVREFVVGMGGTTERTFGGSFVANSQAHNDSCWGVLKLTLRTTSYDWQFVPVAGCSYHDSGTQAAH